MYAHVLRQENLAVVIKRGAVKSAWSFINQPNRGKLEQTCISFVGYIKPRVSLHLEQFSCSCKRRHGYIVLIKISTE